MGNFSFTLLSLSLTHCLDSQELWKLRKARQQQIARKIVNLFKAILRLPFSIVRIKSFFVDFSHTPTWWFRMDFHWNEKTHCKLRILNSPPLCQNQAPSILNQITIENWLILVFFALPVYCSRCKLEIWLFILLYFPLKHLLSFLLSIWCVSSVQVLLESIDYDRDGVSMASFLKLRLCLAIESLVQNHQTPSEINDSTNRTMKKEILLHKLLSIHKTFLFVRFLFSLRSFLFPHSASHFQKDETATRTTTTTESKRIPKKNVKQNKNPNTKIFV